MDIRFLSGLFIGLGSMMLASAIVLRYVLGVFTRGEPSEQAEGLKLAVRAARVIKLDRADIAGK